MSIYILPLFFIAILIIAFFKKMPSYDYFVSGANQAIELCVSTFPCLVAMFILIQLLEQSGILEYVITNTQFFWKVIGIPSEVIELVLLRPFSGSGSLAILSECYTKFGTESYISNCASVIMGTSDTLFYMLAIYFGSTKIKKTGAIIPISLISCLIGNIIACLLCRFI